MFPLPSRLLLIALIACCSAASAQQASPPSHLADDLCSCIGTIDPAGDEHAFDLAVRHCLYTAMREHSGEVIELMHRFPAQDRRYYVLGLLLGSSLDRTCPQYPLIKDRLRTLISPPAEAVPNT